MTISTLYSPASGVLLPLSSIPDPAFSAGLLGPGLGVEPHSESGSRFTAIMAPTSGEIVAAMPHAYGIRTPEGVEYLVHIGIDTVSLNGAPFRHGLAQGSAVERGMPIAEVDLEEIGRSGLSTVVAIVITNAADLGTITPADPGDVGVGAPVLSVRSGDAPR